MTDAQAEWARCKVWIEAALIRCGGFYSIASVEEKIAAGEMAFWPGRNCAAVTEILNFPNGRAFNVFAGGGDLNELTRDMEPAFERLARVLGCRWLIGHGRAGWEKICRPMGYAHGWVVMKKELT